MIRAVIFMAAVVLAGCDLTTHDNTFQCETDGELSEMHVGVGRAARTGDGEWKLTYTSGTGRKVTYLQQRGETCWLEPAP